MIGATLPCDATSVSSVAIWKDIPADWVRPERWHHKGQVVPIDNTFTLTYLEIEDLLGVLHQGAGVAGEEVLGRRGRGGSVGDDVIGRWRHVAVGVGHAVEHATGMEWFRYLDMI